MDLIQQYMTTIVAALIVAVALLAVLLTYRALSRTVRGRRGARLGITEYHEIDKSRRLVLVRRDDVEHLLLIGGEQELVIESNIESGLYRAPQMPAPSVQASNIQPLRPPPRPPAFAERRQPLRAVEPAMPIDRENDNT
jgi:hypothetical protein